MILSINTKFFYVFQNTARLFVCDAKKPYCKLQFCSLSVVYFYQFLNTDEHTDLYAVFKAICNLVCFMQLHRNFK